MAEITVKNDILPNVISAELVYAYGKKVKTVPMEPCGTYHKAALDLPDGEHPYKLILNDGIRMNDPEAYDYREWQNGEIWSILKIYDGKVIIKNYEKLYINNFRIHGSTLTGSTKTLKYPGDKKCRVGFDINNVRGTHSITALWYQPDGSLYHIGETAISADTDSVTSYSATLWIDLNQETHPFLYGVWMVEIYGDGKRMIREFFNVTDSPTGSRPLMNIKV